MWLYLALGSAIFLGFYDITKKKALQQNSPLVVLLVCTLLSTLMLSPCLVLYPGTAQHHLMLMGKGLLVSASWISGIIALKLLPITLVSPLKATRPFFVVFFSVVLFGEKLNAGQWTGVSLALLAIALMSFSSKKEGIHFSSNRGIWAMGISIITGVASALYDKHIMVSMEPLFVQSWSNLYISIDVAIALLVTRLIKKEERRPFKWDWMILATALLITGADMMYFFALNQDGALLSVISTMRRFAAVVTFVFGAIVFHEKNLKAKSLELGLLLVGLVFLLFS